MKKGLKEREISCSEVIDFLKFRFVQNTFIVKSAFKWFIQPLLKWQIFILWSALRAFMTSVRLLHLIPHHPSLYCFYCLHQFFSVPPTFWNIDCNYSVRMAGNSDSPLRSSSKCDCRCLREPQLEVSQPLWKKKKKSEYFKHKKNNWDASEVGLWHYGPSSFSVLFVIAVKSMFLWGTLPGCYS